MKRKPTISIIFPNFNGRQECQILLNSLKALAYPKNKIEVIMVDNASTDESTGFVKKHFPFVKVINLPGNIGPGAARNEGIKRASGEYIFCTDNDVRFTKNSLGPLIEVVESRPKVGIVGGKILDKQSEKLVSCGFNFNRWLGIETGNSRPDKEVECDWVGDAFMLFKKDLIKKIGLFDHKFFFYAEEADFCLRAKKKGYQVLYSPTATINHGKENDNNLMTVKDNYFEYYKSKFRLIRKHLNLLQQFTSFTFHLGIAIPVRMILKKEEYHILKFKAFLKSLNI
ncbi:MAG: glycosyltransferase family 2 protein [bacterium]|nr:glycosyltransferase family 2 protein [bacterium]